MCLDESVYVVYLRFKNDGKLYAESIVNEIDIFYFLQCRLHHLVHGLKEFQLQIFAFLGRKYVENSLHKQLFKAKFQLY